MIEKEFKDQFIHHIMNEMIEYAIFFTDNNGIIQFQNKGARISMGYNDEEIIGSEFRILYSDEAIADNVPEKLMAAAIKDQTVSDEGWRIRKDGSKFFGSGMLTAYYDSNGNVNGFTIVTKDITEKRQQEELLNDIIESAPDALLLVNEDGNIIVANRNVETLFGYSRDELLNKKVEMLIPFHKRVSHPQHRKNFMEKPHSRSMGSGLHLTILNKSGNEIPVDISLSPLSMNNKMVLAVVRDMSEKKKMIDKLQQAKVKAEESERLKSAFLATINHELRTPLNHIIGFSEIISMSTEDNQLLEYSDIINKSGTELLATIEDIIDISQIIHSNVKIRIQSIATSDLMTEIKELSDELLKNSGKSNDIDLVFNLSEYGIKKRYISIDKYKVKQVLKNLIDNAIKFTEKGSVSISCFPADESSVAISVKDTGIGIEKEKQKLIFDFFRQADDSNTRIHGGIGVGLTIADKIAKIIGGKIIIGSESGEGSNFTFIFPAMN